MPLFSLTVGREKRHMSLTYQKLSTALETPTGRCCIHESLIKIKKKILCFGRHLPLYKLFYHHGSACSLPRFSVILAILLLNARRAFAGGTPTFSSAPHGILQITPSQETLLWPQSRPYSSPHFTSPFLPQFLSELQILQFSVWLLINACLSPRV